MKFKPTPLKLIVSLLSGIIANYLFAGNGPFSLVKSVIDCVCVQAPCYCPPVPWIDSAFDPVLIALSLTAIVLVYCIWSAFQKK